ncbi:MAG TPA: protein kinase [Kofleriaceae bacterium]|nr:protein kinase [Kofleriaceae bacterium]
MTMDSSGLGAQATVRCHACNARGSGKGNCKQCGTPFSKRHPPGTILGSYRLEEVIGEGGMGIVYLATHTRLGRRVAIKMLRSHYTTNPQAIHRFFAEARAVNKIHHPNIVQITDFIEQPGDDNYYVMELLEGTNLAHLIVHGGMISLARTFAIMTQVASVLEAVHRAGIVHRDLKPENVFLIERGGQQDFVKLVDFGVAKLIDDTDDFVATNNTNPGAILGTPDYMSPEQASAVPVDHRTDIYAFGAMLYELVTGRLPLKGANFGELVVQLMTVTPTPPSQLSLPHEVPPALEELIMSCLAKQTIDRPDSMETIGERLGEIAEEQGWIVYELNVRPSGPVHARPETNPPPMPGGRKTPPAGVPPLRRPQTTGTPPLKAKTPTPGGSPPLAHAETAEALPAEAKPDTSPSTVRSPSALLADRLAPTMLAPGPEPVAAPKPTPRRFPMWMLAAGAGVVIAIVVVVVALAGGAKRDEAAAKVDAQLRIADERIAAGKLVAPGGDDALEHLLEAKRLAPANKGVADRLHKLAREYEQLADQAIAAGTFAEAAAHLQVVLSAEPDNKAAAAKMKDVEAHMLERQRPGAPR